MSAPTVQGRHTRILQILSHLQSGGGLNANELAGQLDVCRRTIFRDLSLLRDVGIDIYFDEEMDCYRLSSRNDLVVTPVLDTEELTTLVAAAHLSVLQNIPACDSLLRQSTTKLLAQSSFQVRHSVTRLTSSCTLRTPSDEYSPRTVLVVQHILQAIRQRRTLRVRLAESECENCIETKFAPFQLVATSDAWQVTGRSWHHRGVRTFDPREIERADITNEIYAIPRGYQARE